MNGKKLLLVACFALALVIGQALIIPGDVWHSSQAGDDLNEGPFLPDELAGGDYDDNASFYVFSNDTVSEEPVYIYDNATDDYEVAVFYDSSELANKTLYVRDATSYYVVSNDTVNYTAGGSSDMDNTGASLDNLISGTLDARELEQYDDISTAAGESGFADSIPWQLKSMGYLAVCSVIFVFLFARLSPDDIMGGVRKDIYDFISENPGEHLASITKEFNLSSSSARHHLYVLEASDKIVSHKPGKHKHYYINQNGYSRFTSGSAEYKEVMSALRNDTSRDIVKFISGHRGANQQAISQALGIHPSTVNWHAKRLRAANIIRKTRQGKDIIYSLNDDLELARVIQIIEGT